MDISLVSSGIVLAVGGILATLGLLAIFSIISMGTTLKRIAENQKKQDARLAQLLDTLLSSCFQAE